MLFDRSDCAALAPISSNDHHQSEQQVEQFLRLLLLFVVVVVFSDNVAAAFDHNCCTCHCFVSRCQLQAQARKRTDNYKADGDIVVVVVSSCVRVCVKYM